jgi:hypothetical protein
MGDIWKNQPSCILCVMSLAQPALFFLFAQESNYSRALNEVVFIDCGGLFRCRILANQLFFLIALALVSPMVLSAVQNMTPICTFVLAAVLGYSFLP